MAYLSTYERYQIETMLKDGVSVKEIAARLGRHFTTIYKEIKKGTIELLDYKTWDTRKEYCADVAERVTRERGHNKGLVKDFTYNTALLNRFSELIGKQHYSPYAAIQIVTKEGYKTCGEVTLYKYIHMGLIPNVSDRDLYIKKNKKVKPRNPREARQKIFYIRNRKSIEERPQEVSERKVYGHWEMDTVYSGRHTRSKAALLVLTERTTLEQLTYLMPDRSLKSVITCLDKLEVKIGPSVFRNKFKTITADNGSEFGDSTLLERSAKNHNKKRTTVYFCHPYCSSERARNENQNRFYRRWVKRGGDLGKLTAGQWDEINTWINEMPRKSLGGLSSLEYRQRLGLA